MGRVTLSGRVATGSGQGAAFTQLAWAREQFIAKLGVDPFPGTLNLVLDDPADLQTWGKLRADPGRLIMPSDPQWCQAHCYPVRIGGRFPGAIVYPNVPGYPEAQIELIAALRLREWLSLRDGDRLEVEVSRPLAPGAVIFDLDGTLVDSLEAYRVVAAKVAAPHGIQVTREQVRRSMNSGQHFWEMILPSDRPDRTELIRNLRSEAVRLWPEVLKVHGRVLAGSRPTLELLRSRGVRLGIVTGSLPIALDPLRNDALLDFFGAVVTGVDVERRKPDPQGLHRCAAMLGVTPEESIYVGDSPLDIQASRAAGMGAVAVLTGAGDSALLAAEEPAWVIHSIADLPEIVTAR